MSVVNFRSDRRIRNSERQILREFCTALGGDPVMLANKLGVKVFEAHLQVGQSGYLEFDEGCGSSSGYKIVINQTDSVERKKFTVAHELGHFVLHRDEPEFNTAKALGDNVFTFPSAYRSSDFWDNSEREDRFEREANSFAALILLPPAPLKQSAEYQQGAPIALAKRLILSKTFVLRRFEEVKFPSDF